MNKIVKRIQDRRNYLELQDAINNAGTPAMRDELLAISQRYYA